MGSLLTRAFDEAAGLPVEFCSCCGGPTARAPLVMILEDDQGLRECSACGGLVAPSGRSLRRTGGGPVKVIRLMNDKDEDHELSA